MAKIPFNIKFKPQIESGEYKVITAKEQSVRIICWDRSTTYWKIVALVLAPDGKTENPFTYDVNGKESDGCLHDYELDLFIITPELELTEFEKAVRDLCWNVGMGEVVFSNDIVKEKASKLLKLAYQNLKAELDQIVPNKIDRELLVKLKEQAFPELSFNQSYKWCGGHLNKAFSHFQAATYAIYREMLHARTVNKGLDNVYKSPTLRCEGVDVPKISIKED